MPRSGPRRVIVGVRLYADAIARIDKLAEEDGVNRSEMIRKLLAYAVKHWRKG